MTEFLFVRHGEATTNVIPDRIGGRSAAAPLTEKGRVQAGLLGEYLLATDTLPDVVFSSGAVRADTTAALALASAGARRSVTYDDRLLEMSQGDFEGELRTIAYTPENIERYDIRSMTGKFPGGESMNDVQQRMLAFVNDRTQEYPEQRILVFGHGLAIRALTGAIRGIEKQAFLAEVTDNVSLTVVDTSPSSMHVRFIGKNVIPEYT